MKFFPSILSGIIVAIVGLYFSSDWKEERLVYTLSEPATFGVISFQNLEIRNDGFDPATKVIISISKKAQDAKQIEFAAKFDLNGDKQSVGGGFERIRRGERILVSLTSKAGPISLDDLSIKSDRSIAAFSLPNAWSFDMKSFWIGAGAFFMFVMLMGIAVPAYKEYQRKARAALQSSVET
jgi:hypothetical protein